MLSGLSNTTLSAHIEEFSTYASSPKEWNQWNIHTKFFHLLSEIAFYEQNPGHQKTLSDKICTYLFENYKTPFSAAMLEEKFFLSYKHMAFVFKKEKQMTMQQFHTKTRMEKACQLLKHTMLPIGEISQMVGYHDKLYFSRCFHTCMNMSPTSYRRLPEIY